MKYVCVLSCLPVIAYLCPQCGSYCIGLFQNQNHLFSMAAMHAGFTQLHTHPFNGLFCGLPSWDGTRKVKPIRISLKQETVSGSGISWAICKSAPRSRQITMPAPHHSVFYRPDIRPSCHPTNSVKALKALHLFFYNVTMWACVLSRFAFVCMTQFSNKVMLFRSQVGLVFEWTDLD